MGAVGVRRGTAHMVLDSDVFALAHGCRVSRAFSKALNRPKELHLCLICFGNCVLCIAKPEGLDRDSCVKSPTSKATSCAVSAGRAARFHAAMQAKT